jgi:hypothetical protein
MGFLQEQTSASKYEVDVHEQIYTDYAIDCSSFRRCYVQQYDRHTREAKPFIKSGSIERVDIETRAP